MGEERQDAGGMKIERRRVGREPRRDAGRCVRQGHAGGVVDSNVPARELGGDAARERAVRRDERRRAVRHGERLAQGDGRGERLVALVRRFHDLDARAARSGEIAAAGWLHRGPTVGRIGGAKGFRDHSRAGRERLGGRGEAAHIPARDLQMRLEEAAQHGLRMPMHRIAVVRLEAADGGPARLVEISVEPRQDDGAVRKPGDGGEESGGGRHGARRARRDDGSRRPVAKQPPGLRVDQEAAAPGRIARLPLGQDLGPVLGGDADEIEGQAEIFRVVRLDRLGEPIPGDVLAGEPVHEAFQIAGESDRVRRRGRHEERRAGRQLHPRPVDGLGPDLDQPGQNEPPLQRRDRRRQGLGILEGDGVGRVSGKLELGVVGLAERHDAGQKARPVVAASCEKRREGARGAAGRQVDGGACKGGGLASEAVEDMTLHEGIGQRRQERRAGRNREDAGFR
jgi:hypothetical protein